MRLVFFYGNESVIHPTIGEIRPGFNEVYDEDVAAALLEAGRTSGQFTEGKELVIDDPRLPDAAPLEQAPPSDIESITTVESVTAPAPRARKRAQE